MVTLVGQGLTFGPLVRRLGVLRDPHEDERQRVAVRLSANAAALARLESIADSMAIPEEVITNLRRSASQRRRLDQERLAEIERSVDRSGGVEAARGDGRPLRPPPRALSSWLHKQMIEAEREELLDARQEGRLSDGNLRILERELDFQEQLLPQRSRAARRYRSGPVPARNALRPLGR